MRHEALGSALCIAAACAAASGCGASAAAPPPRGVAVSAPRPLPRDVRAPAAVAAGRDGTLAVLSGPDPGEGAVSPLYVAVKRPDGRWRPTRRVSGPTFGAHTARVAVDALGGVTVAWVAACRLDNSSSCAPQSFYKARSMTPAGRWGPIDTLGRAGFDPPLEIAAETRGGASVAWETSGGVAVARHAAGRRFGRAVHFERSGRGAPALATSATRRAYLAFATTPPGEPPRDVPQPFVAVAVRGRDGRWSEAQRVSPRPAAQPALSVASDGAVVVAWRESSFDADDFPRAGGVGAAVGTADGRFAPAHHVADARTLAVRLASGRTGATVLTWSSESLDESGILRYAARAAKATRFAPARRIPGTETKVTDSTVAMLDDGTALLVAPHGSRFGIYLAVRPPGGVFGRARRIVPRGLWPVLAAATGERAAVLYGLGGASVRRYVTVTRR